MVLQFFFIVVQAYGWRRWTIKNRAEFPISSLTLRRWLGEAALFVLGWSVWTTLILNFPSWIATIYDVNIPQAQMPWLDSFTASLSVWAISLQARRKWENWILWLLADSIYIPLYISVGKPLTALLYGIFLLLALSGLRSWYQQRV
jgi:nicotinamide mononucleotide transporter